MSELNILIGVPTKEAIDIDAAISIMNLDWDGHNITYTHSQGAGVYGVAQARNNLVKQANDALEARELIKGCVQQGAPVNGFDKLFMIDSDMIVPQDAIINLLDPDVPIVTGCARYKNDSMRSPLFRYTTDRQGDASWLWNEIPRGRFEIKSGGVACAMIDVELLKRMHRPWFVWTERGNGTYVGEDIGFYEELQRIGIKPQADGRVRCGHIGRKIYE